ncbi:GDSL-type esterase/lipase family protein [Rufibacter latericius]|uniref:Sialate O-acetylesterase n=1 Tax=Rufibacter latericius TaxID=2487040 RepID=A0A3M9N1M0_9BACT|nr:GDSL-type esterase/lipase family protein [Rufibacter latericius]RNI31701.1 sialate O-acetylesterase [Rufibacter latericius]
MKKHFSLLYLLVLLVCFSASAQNKIKVACVGNSITEGSGLKQPYPAALQQLLGDAYEVRNYGLGGRTLLKKGDVPYWNETKYQDALGWNPDIVIIKLGTNDSKPQNWKFKDEFVPDYIQFVTSFKKLPSKPQVYVCNPLPVFETKWGINEPVVNNEILPAVKKIARKTKVKTIDLYTPFLGKPELTYDGIHPNDDGAALLASEVHKALQANRSKTARK